MKVKIIGGGLAGCALAYVLKKHGAEPVIYESGETLASGASGNDVGLYNPRFSAQLDSVAQYYSDAYFLGLEVFEKFGEAIDWRPCGALAFMTDERRVIRFRKTAASWGWSEADMRVVEAGEASEIAGIEIPYECLHIPRSGNISPKKLCHEYARGIEVHLSHTITDIESLGGDVTILSCGVGAKNFEAAAHLPLKSVRGQVSYIEQNDLTKNLRVALSYSGYLAPAREGVHCLGATFQPWLDHDELIPEDNGTNLDKLFDALPSLKGEYKVVNSLAGIRATSKDHFPVVGQLDENLYISSAHGSHGILSTLKSAEILANKIIYNDYSVSGGVLAALAPDRFGV